MTNPPGLLDFYERYGDEDACWQRLRQARWDEQGFTCPNCGEDEHWGPIQTRKLFQCHECGKQTSVTAGTILQDTKLDLTTWFLAAYLVYTAKKGISSYDLARKLGTSQKTAYYLQQKLCSAISEQRGRHLFGLVEADDAFVGPASNTQGRGTDKETVLGLVENREEQAGQVRLRHVPDGRNKSLQPPIQEDVQEASQVRTDNFRGYWSLHERGVEHDIVQPEDSADMMSVLPWVHIVFGNLKRVLNGTHAKVSDRALQAYLDVFCFRFNRRGFLGQAVEEGIGALVSSRPVLRDDLRQREVPWAAS
jgi:transposase-like protein